MCFLILKSMKNNKIILSLIPVMFTFFVMGFVDLVGTATNYIKEDFELSHTISNFLPSMVFFWFLIFSVPTGMLMNKIGRRKTVLLSLIINVLALFVPLINYSFISMLISFSLLGIGNTLMQVSINPLLSDIIRGDKLASSMTFGQFIKAIASFLAPIIASWAAKELGDWKLLFPIFMSTAMIALVWLSFTSIKEEGNKGSGSTFLQCFSLLGSKTIVYSFLGIMCHVGIDVGINVTAPKILMERLDILLDNAVYATSVYFLFRTIGSFFGAFILTRFSEKWFFGLSVTIMIVAIIGLFLFQSLLPIYVCIALIGVGNSNIFPIILSQAMLSMPDKKNEVSALMIMGLFGGTVFPLSMGILTDALNSQMGALLILSLGITYLAYLTLRLKDKIRQ